MEETQRAEPSFLKDLLAAVLIVAGFVAAMPLAVVSLPGYLLMTGFDALERAVPLLSGYYGPAVVVYLLVLALVAAVLSPQLRARIDMTPWWYAPVALALGVVGLVVLGVVGLVYLPGGADPASVAIGMLTAGVLWVLAWVTVRGGRKRQAAVQDLERQMARREVATGGDDADGEESDADGDASEADADASDDRD